MPFKSEAQRRYMFMHHPKIAKKWAKEYPNQGHLPYHHSKVNPRKKRKPYWVT